jgi:hypothetical protein
MSQIIWKRKVIDTKSAINTVSTDVYNTVPALDPADGTTPCGYFNVMAGSRLSVDIHFKSGSAGGVVMIQSSDVQTPVPAHPVLLDTITWAADDSVIHKEYASESFPFARAIISTGITGGGKVDVWFTLWL